MLGGSLGEGFTLEDASWKPIPHLHSVRQVCSETRIGSEMIRGVSGGQKKRVTTGEMIVGPAKVLLMDSISTGLDSSTTYLIVR